MLATAGAAAVLPIPAVALGATRRPPLELYFPQDPIDTWFLQTFGLVKADGRVHMGIDLMAPKLTPVYAIADGTVNRIAQSPRAGRHMIIDHADGWQSWYLHLNNDDPGRNNGRADWALTVIEGLEEGSHVTAGRHMAFVGNSGNAEGGMSHTHFELAPRVSNPQSVSVSCRRSGRRPRGCQEAAAGRHGSQHVPARGRRAGDRC